MGEVDGAQKTEGCPCLVPSARTLRVEAAGRHETSLCPEHLGQEYEEDLYENSESRGMGPPTLLAWRKQVD